MLSFMKTVILFKKIAVTAGFGQWLSERLIFLTEKASQEASDVHPM